MEEKKSLGMGILLFFLFVAIIAIACMGYYIYRSSNNNKIKQDTTETVKSIQKQIATSINNTLSTFTFNFPIKRAVILPPKE